MGSRHQACQADDLEHRAHRRTVHFATSGVRILTVMILANKSSPVAMDACKGNPKRYRERPQSCPYYGYAL